MNAAFKMLKKPYIHCLDVAYNYQIKRHILESLENPIPKRGIFFKVGFVSWAYLDSSGGLRITRNYAWDGCTPKIKIFGKVRGVPDGPISEKTGLPQTYHASLIHDVLCQFQEHKKMPFTREQIDLIFYDVMVRDGFKHAKLYFKAVRLLGGVYSKITGLIK